jgi:hypothetical protein
MVGNEDEENIEIRKRKRKKRSDIEWYGYSGGNGI